MGLSVEHVIPGKYGGILGTNTSTEMVMAKIKLFLKNSWGLGCEYC